MVQVQFSFIDGSIADGYFITEFGDPFIQECVDGLLKGEVLNSLTITIID